MHTNYERKKRSSGVKTGGKKTAEKKIVMEYIKCQRMDQNQSWDFNNPEKTLRIKSGINDLCFRIMRLKILKL